MKIFISVDIEGVAGVADRDDTKLEGVEYETARRWMTAEANAAIEGALAAGAIEIVVADSHGHMRNLLPDLLHPDALLIRGTPRGVSMMDGLDHSFAAGFFDRVSRDGWQRIGHFSAYLPGNLHLFCAA